MKAFRFYNVLIKPLLFQEVVHKHMRYVHIVLKSWVSAVLSDLDSIGVGPVQVTLDFLVFFGGV